MILQGRPGVAARTEVMIATRANTRFAPTEMT